MGTECSMKFCGDKKYFCTVELTLQVIGGKWKPIIIHRLANEGTLRFSEGETVNPQYHAEDVDPAVARAGGRRCG